MLVFFGCAASPGGVRRGAPALRGSRPDAPPARHTSKPAAAGCRPRPRWRQRCREHCHAARQPRAEAAQGAVTRSHNDEGQEAAVLSPKLPSSLTRQLGPKHLLHPWRRPAQGAARCYCCLSPPGPTPAHAKVRRSRSRTRTLRDLPRLS